MFYVNFIGPLATRIKFMLRSSGRFGHTGLPRCLGHKVSLLNVIVETIDIWVLIKKNRLVKDIPSTTLHSQYDIVVV